MSYGFFNTMRLIKLTINDLNINISDNYTNITFDDFNKYHIPWIL